MHKALTWNMLSSPLLLPLDDPPGLELSPLFAFLAGFSGALGFFLFAFKTNTFSNLPHINYGQKMYLIYGPDSAAQKDNKPQSAQVIFCTRLTRRALCL